MFTENEIKKVKGVAMKTIATKKEDDNVSRVDSKENGALVKSM